MTGKHRKHVHRYKTVRTTSAIENGRAVKYEFQVCQNPGCDKPDNLKITRS